MIANRIKIKWDASDEYVDIDPLTLKILPKINQTTEWWPDEEKWVRYVTAASAKRRPDGTVVLTVKYSPANNRHIKEDDVCWGEAQIEIVPGATFGKAFWRDASGEENSGPAKWKIERRHLIEEKERTFVARLNRRQERFRKALIACDQQCILTGETATAALEAAHIIPANMGGTEIEENGILLRADLHRLFDAELLKISAEGIVSVENAAGKSYMALLEGKRLPKATFHRVKRALGERNLGV